MSLFSLDVFHSVLIYLINFAILSYFCDGQGSIVRDSLEIEDVDEGSIFYANSTRLAVQVSSFLNPHLSLFSILANICSVAIQMTIYWCSFQVDDKKTVGLNAFAQIAPSCPIIADLVTVHNLFDALTSSSGGRLHFLVYDKYLRSLDR